MIRRRLGKFEKVQTMSGEYAPFNAVGIVRIKRGPAAENVRLALEYLQKKHPLLQVRILKEDRAYVFVHEKALPVPFSVLERSPDEYWQSITEEELNSGFDIAAGPLFRRRYLCPADRESADIINLIAAVEDRYGIVVDEEEIPAVRTAEDLFLAVRSKVSAGRG